MIDLENIDKVLSLIDILGATINTPFYSINCNDDQYLKITIFKLSMNTLYNKIQRILYIQ